MGTPLRHAETQNGAGQEAGTNRFWERHRAICAAQEIADPRVSCLSMITQTITRFPKCIRCRGREREKEKGKGERERACTRLRESRKFAREREFRSARGPSARLGEKHRPRGERTLFSNARAAFRASLIVRNLSRRILSFPSCRGALLNPRQRSDERRTLSPENN